MKRLLIGLLLVALLASGCTAQKVYIVAPITTTASLTWDAIVNLPVGSEVELTGYCLNTGTDGSYFSYVIGDGLETDGAFTVISRGTVPQKGVHVQIKGHIDTSENILHTSYRSILIVEESRTIIN